MSPVRPGARVLFWSELFPPYIGGNESLAAKLLPALHDRGYEFVVVTSHQSLHLPDRDEYRGLPIHRFPFRDALRRRSVDEIAALRREMASFVTRLAPALIHASCIGPSSYFLPRARDEVGTVPCLVHLHSPLVPSQMGGHESILQRVLERAQWVVGVSAAVLAGVTNVFPSIRSRSSVIPNAIEEPRRAPAALPFDPPSVLCLGRLVTEKGFDVALRVFADVRARRPGVRFVVAGDGVERSRLEQQARDLDLTEDVEFLGWVRPDDIASVIDGATLVLMPSRREGLPLVAIEAAYMGRPVVATSVSGLGEVVVDGETGFLAPQDDVATLSRAVLTLLARPDRARHMGAAARRRARRLYGLPLCVDRFDDLYRRLLAANSGRITPAGHR